MFTSLGNSIPRNGLVGEWLLDGNALDTSGNGYNGTNTNGVYVKTYNGYQLQSWKGNGSTSYINMGNVCNIGTGDFSYSIWFKTSTSSSGGTVRSVFGKSRAGQQIGRYSFNFYNGNLISLLEFNGVKLSNIEISETPYIDGKRHLFTATFKRTGNHILYIDGVQKGSISISSYSGVNAISTDLLGVGAYLNTTGTAFTQAFLNGETNIARIYNRVLSQDEIQLLYLEGRKLLGPTNIAKYPKLFEGLVGYWDFRGTAHNLVDGVLATVSGATLTTDRFGNSNSAYSFNGTSNYINNTLTPTNNQDLTSYCWVYVTNNPTGQSKIIVWQNSTQQLLTLYYVTISGVQYLKLSDTVDTVYTASHTVNLAGTGWHCIITTKIGTTQQIYLDGVAVGNTGNSGNNTFTGGVNGLYIARDADAASQYFNGVINECIIINRGLSADEVKLLYNLTSKDYIYPNPSYDLLNLRDGLVLDLNEQGKDLSGNGNNGTLVNSPTVVRQGKAKGLSYNGTSQYINFSTTKPITISNPFTLSSWFKYNGSGELGEIISLGDETNFMGGALYYQSSYPKLYVTTGGFGNIIITSSIIMEVGKIYMITGVQVSLSLRYLYVNGKLVGTSTTTLPSKPNNNQAMQVGAFGTGYYVNGNIFNPRIRNRALSEKEIEQLYYSQKGNYIY